VTPDEAADHGNALDSDGPGIGHPHRNTYVDMGEARTYEGPGVAAGAFVMLSSVTTRR
jgi:hypothetical protein